VALVGLLRCRRCGHKLYANYRASGVSYLCRGGATQQNSRGKGCFSFRAAHVEERLAELILEVASPAAATAAIQATERLAAIQGQERRLIVDRFEACRERETRAAREYKKTDATYATVRQRLAQEWEETLLAVQKEEEQLARFDRRRQGVPTAEQRQELERLGEDLCRIWHHPKASMVLKKQIVRTLIEEIVVDLEKLQSEVVLTIHWAGGHHTELRTSTQWRRRRGKTANVKFIVRSLCKLLTDSSIASVLNREQLACDNGTTWTSERVAEFRKQHRILAYCAETKEKHGWLNQAEAATCLAISPMSVSRLVRIGILPAEQPLAGLPTVIKRQDLPLDRVKQAVLQLKSSNNHPLSQDPNQQNLFKTDDSCDS
jgi:hypothetical protein